MTKKDRQVAKKELQRSMTISSTHGIPFEEEDPSPPTSPQPAPSATSGATAPAPTTKVPRLMQFFFKRRPKPEELQDRNVLLASPTVDGRLHESGRHLERAMAADNLRQRLSTRVSKQDLIQRGILTPDYSAPNAKPQHAPATTSAAAATSSTASPAKPPGTPSGRRKAEKVPLPPKRPTFAVSPEELVKLYPEMEGCVPKILWDCAEPIMRELDAEGLFRVPGCQAEVQELKAYAEERGEVNFAIVTSVHSLTGLIGHFFRSLPEPLLTFGLYNEWVAIGKAYNLENEATEIALSKIKKLLEQIPRANFVILRWFLELLHMVTLLSKKNKMAAENVSTVFGPTLLRAREESLETLSLMRYHAVIVELLVRFFEELFPVDPNEQPPAVLLSTARPIPPLIATLNPKHQTPPKPHMLSGGGDTRVRSNSAGSISVMPSVKRVMPTAAYGAVVRSIAAKVVEEVDEAGPETPPMTPVQERASQSSGSPLKPEPPAAAAKPTEPAKPANPAKPAEPSHPRPAGAHPPPPPTTPKPIRTALMRSLERTRAATLMEHTSRKTSSETVVATPAVSPIKTPATPETFHRRNPTATPAATPAATSTDTQEASTTSDATPAPATGAFEPRREAPKPPKFTDVPKRPLPLPKPRAPLGQVSTSVGAATATATATAAAHPPAVKVTPAPQTSSATTQLPPASGKAVVANPGLAKSTSVVVVTGLSPRPKAPQLAVDPRRSMSLQHLSPAVIMRLRNIFDDPAAAAAAAASAAATSSQPVPGSGVI